MDVKKKICLFTASMYPIKHSYAYAIAKKLSHNYDVTILSLNNPIPDCEKKYLGINGDGYYYIYEGSYVIKIKYIYTKFQELRYNLSYSRNSIFCLINKFLGLLNRIASIFLIYGFNDFCIKILTNVFKKELLPKGYKCILSFSEPIITHLGAIRIKKTESINVKCIGMFYDPFATPIRKDVKIKHLIDLEKNIINELDYCYVTNESLKYRKELYSDINKRCGRLPFFLGVKQIQDKRNDKVKFIFAGNFYKDIRRPEPIIKFINMLNFDYEFYFYTNDCDNLIMKLSEANNKIIFNKIQPREELFERYKYINYFVNVENTINLYCPSKIYEYIGLGRPIINFYHTEPSDPLKKYPLCFNIKIDSINKCEYEVKDFIINNLFSSVDLTKINELYYEESIDNFIELLKKDIDNN